MKVQHVASPYPFCSSVSPVLLQPNTTSTTHPRPEPSPNLAALAFCRDILIFFFTLPRAPDEVQSLSSSPSHRPNGCHIASLLSSPAASTFFL